MPGKGGVIQVFLSTDPATGEIRSFFFQRLESPAARQLRSKEFRAQFTGLTLADFYKHDYYAAADPGAKADKVAAIKPPALDPAGQPDYEASLRGVRKNLILLDYFVYGRRFEPFFERAQQAKANSKGIINANDIYSLRIDRCSSASVFVWRAIARPSRYGKFTGAPKGRGRRPDRAPQGLSRERPSRSKAPSREQCKTMGCYFFFQSGKRCLRVDLQDIAMTAPMREGHRARVEGQMVPHGDGYQFFASAVEFR